MSNKKFNPTWLLAIFVPIIFIIAIVAFLSSEECYAQYCITGWQVLKLEWPGFWIFAWGGLGLGLIMWAVAYLNESGTGAIGRKLPGSDGLTITLVLVGLMVMCGPWGKACTDKSNGGVTAPGYKPKIEQVDTTLQNHSQIPDSGEVNKPTSFIRVLGGKGLTIHVMTKSEAFIYDDIYLNKCMPIYKVLVFSDSGPAGSWSSDLKNSRIENLLKDYYN